MGERIMKHFTYVHIRKQGQIQLSLVETVFIDEIPHLVFQDESDPTLSKRIALDPKRFHRHGGLSANDAHIYELSIDHPTKARRQNKVFILPNFQKQQQQQSMGI